MMPQNLVAAKSLELISHVDRLKDLIQEAMADHRPLHEFEAQVFRVVLELGRTALKTLIEAHGPGDVGANYELPDGRIVKRLEQHTRSYVSIFGEFELKRFVYGERSGRKQEVVPLDSRLALPESKFSFLLQDWDQSLTMESPFARVSETIEKIFGLRQHVDSLERMNRDMSTTAEPFQQQLVAPPSDEEGELLVVTADGKGVPIRRSADTSAIETHRSRSGPKPDRKKMAIVGSVYSVDRFVRTPEEVTEALFREPDEPRSTTKRPRPQHKRVRATLNQLADNEDDSIFAAPAIFGWMADESASRNPDGKKIVVCIMDGQPSLWEARDAQLTTAAQVVDILDILHVTPRLWKAAHLFCAVDSREAKQFVRERVLRILRGEVTSVVRGLRRLASLQSLASRKRKDLEKICNYMLKNKDRMKYGEYLQNGYPIASGVIEGACRCVVKDRLERTGMTWTVSGANAMLKLRSIHLSDQWDAYVSFHVESEIQRLYPERNQHRDLTFQLAI
jgi:hypothetical protein